MSWLLVLSVHSGADPGQPANKRVPILAPHQAPIRFIPYAKASTDLAHAHFVDRADPRLVAGYFIVDDIGQYAVWARGPKGPMYGYGLPSGRESKSVRNVPYASYSGQKQYFLVSDSRERIERIEVILPYDPAKLPGRFRPITRWSGKCKVYAKFKIDEYGQPYTWIAARSPRTKKFDGEYEYDNGAGSFYTFKHDDQDVDFGWVPMGVNTDGALQVSVKLTEVGAKRPASYSFKIRVAPRSRAET